MNVEKRRSFVRVLIVDSLGRVLIVAPRQKGAREWNLPGGKVDKGESPESAARREVLEETGLLLKSLSLFHEDRFQLGSTEWHGYFYEAEPLETEAYNMEPHKLFKVGFVDMPSVAKKGSKAFLVDTLEKWRNDPVDEESCQKRLDLSLSSPNSSESSE